MDIFRDVVVPMMDILDDPTATEEEKLAAEDTLDMAYGRFEAFDLIEGD